ncbi:MAG: leucine-rich repeat protein [Bacteroidaceae bacterium]
MKIAQGTTEIKDMAYYGKTDFNKVVIPRSVTKIGQLAFHNCTLHQS